MVNTISDINNRATYCTISYFKCSTVYIGDEAINVVILTTIEKIQVYLNHKYVRSGSPDYLIFTISYIVTAKIEQEMDDINRLV